ncbi:MAG: TonB-dependent receptor [Hydrogenophaga sp.]|nr:TonB-dependent receptor [Hydrogenophaga sp.]
MKIRQLRAPLAALPLAVLAALPSHAQTVASSDLPETVVTATRFNETLASLPMGVSVITADDIRASGASTVNEAVMRLLGVPGRLDYYGGSNYTLDLRGFGETANSNQVVVVDGIRLSEADLSVPRLDAIAIDTVERIEVVRGSGAVLYGEGATGGVIVITTKAGMGKERRSKASGYVGVGSHNLLDYRAAATVVSGGFSLDLHGQRRDTDNHRENFRASSKVGGATGQWSNESVRLGLKHSLEDQRSGLPGALSSTDFQANPGKASDTTSRSRIQSEYSGVFGELLLGDWSLAAEAGRRDKELSGDYGAYTVDAENVSLRVKRDSQFAGLKNSLIVGHDRGRWSRDMSSKTDISRSDALYVKDDLTLSSGTRLSAGVRTERLDKNPGGNAPVKDRLQAWELGVSQTLDARTTAWGRLGTSFRLANLDELNSLYSTPDLRPQTSKDFELGGRWTHAPFKVETRYYRSSLVDEIALDQVIYKNTNLDPTRRQGLELDVDWAYSRSLKLSTRVAVRRSTFRGGLYAGNDVPLVPGQSLALRADWTPVAGQRVSGGVTWVGTQKPDAANQCRIPSYTLVDARYAMQRGNYEWSLGVNNLFDRNYYTLAFGCTGGGQTTSIYPEAGRTFTAALRVSF